MSEKQLSIFGGMQLPAYLQGNTEAAGADDLEGGGGGGGMPIPRVSIGGFRFVVKDSDGEELHKSKKMAAGHFVILGGAPRGKGTSKLYYRDGYDEDNPTPPDCSSVDGIRPDSWADDPQSETCATCPQNAWGSADKGKGKACRDKKLLLLVPPTAIEEDNIWYLQVPPKSLKAMSLYAKQLKKHNVPMHAVVVELAFDEEEEYPVLTFAAKGFLSEEDAAKASALLPKVAELIDDYVGGDSAPRSQEVAPPKLGAYVPPAEDDAEEEVVEPPKPKKTTPKKSSARRRTTEDDKPAEPKVEDDDSGDDSLDALLGSWSAGG